VAPEIHIAEVDYAPFDLVTTTRIRDTEGEPTKWAAIEGLRDGGTPEARMRYLDLWHQRDVHLECFGDKALARRNLGRALAWK
jgi:hypothetical protein